MRRRQGPKSSHINPAVKSLHWLKIKQCIDSKILSLTYKVLTTTQPLYPYNLISVQPHRSTRSSDVVTLSLAHLPLPLWRSFRLPLFPSRITLSLESASQGTSRAHWSWRSITLIWSHTCHFVISFITTVFIHYSFCLLHQAQNSSFHKSFSP